MLQSGEDPYFTDERIEALVQAIHGAFPDCAITLSIGERNARAYQRFFNAGACRYLLRHETAAPDHYHSLHPRSMSFSHRMHCLTELKQIGYQTGAGMLVGSPGQTVDTLAEDMLFLQNFQPEMVGIGPFIAQKDTPFSSKPSGSADLTLYLLGLIRLMLPDVLLPATTALATLSPQKRYDAILVGANVIMPNISPQSARKKYQLYNNKYSEGTESLEGIDRLRSDLKKIDRIISLSRGDAPGFYPTNY